MPQLASEIMVGASGAVYVAPTGTALPVDITTALNAAFVDYGLITEDGITAEPAMEQEILRSWQVLGRVRTIVTQRDFQVTFALQQWNELTLPFSFGGGTVTGVNPFIFTPTETQVRDVRAMVIQWADGTRDFRLVIPEAEVTDLASFTLSKTAEAALGVTVNAISGAAAGYSWRIITDDAQFAV
jgi:hypothetical protein